MKKELVSLSRTVKSARQETRETKQIAKVSEDKLTEVEATLKAERKLHNNNIELEKASSAEALIMAVLAVAKAKVYVILHYYVLSNLLPSLICCLIYGALPD